MPPLHAPGAMDLMVRTLSGEGLTVRAEVGSTVADLKAQICMQRQTAPVQQRLLLDRKELLDVRAVSDCGVTDGSELTLLVTTALMPGTYTGILDLDVRQGASLAYELVAMEDGSFCILGRYSYMTWNEESLGEEESVCEGR